MPAPDEFDPEPVIARLARGGVDFVVVGGLAGLLHGSSYPTYDVDIAYGREPTNLERLAEVLRNLGATLREAPADLPFLLDAKTLATGANFTFDTSLGPLDILGDAAGAPAYEHLRREAEVGRLGDVEVRYAALDHLIAMKEAAGRTKDKLMATEYRVLADEIRRRDSSLD